MARHRLRAKVLIGKRRAWYGVHAGTAAHKKKNAATNQQSEERKCFHAASHTIFENECECRNTKMDGTKVRDGFHLSAWPCERPRQFGGRLHFDG